MNATEIHIEWRRRLPIAPRNSNLKGVSGEVRSRARSLPMPVEFTQSQTMDVLPKKRLTPEVVATLLSMDLASEGNSLATYQKKGLGDVPSRVSDDNPAQGSRMSSSKRLTSRDNIGIVKIVKSPGQPLGFSLRECNDSQFEKPGGIFVSRLTAGGVVEQNLLLHAGDEILEINNVTVHGYKLSDVVAMIQLPRRLALKVRFRGNHHQNSVETQRKFPEKPTLGINNNIYDADKTGKNRGADNKSRHELREGGPNLAQRQMGTYGQTRTCTDGVSAPNALNDRRSSDISLRSSGRILPAPPESGPNKPRNSPRFEDSSTLISSKPHLSKMSTEVLQAEVSQPKLNPNLMSQHQKGESAIASGTKHKNHRRSAAVLPVSDGKSPNSQFQGNPDLFPETGEVAGKRVDPGDIKFDIVPSSPSSANFGPGPGLISRTYEIQGGHSNRDCTPTSSPVASRSIKTDSTLQTFDSSSSLSSSDSPKSHYRGPFLGKPRAGDTARQSRSELRAHSSCPSIDASPVSSSAETEEQLSKSKNTCSDGSKQQKPPLLLHSVSSDELNQTHNSWFAKIGNQTRKHVRKFSEGTQLRAPKGGDVYRVPPELTDVPTDDIGYRPYPGRGGNENNRNARAVTGMLVLHIVKGSRITPGETALKDKRKKIKLFCTVDSDGIRQACTCTKKGLNNFQWNESFEIMFQRTREINLTVNMHSKKDGDQTLSRASLCLAQLLSEGGEHVLAVNLDPVGMLYVRLQFTDMKLLLQRTPSQKKEGVFGFSLETVLRRENSRIPAIVGKCVEEINRRGLEVTGIYRLCGNAAKKRTLRAEFESNGANVVLDQNENLVDVNVLTGLLKDYLRELPNPLLSEKVREMLCEALATETRCESSERSLVKEIANTFATTSRDTIMYLLDHFAAVLMNSDVNKMDSHNLAVCIGPVLLCPSLGATSSDTLSDTKKDISAIKLLLEIWPKPEQVSAC